MMDDKSEMHGHDMDNTMYIVYSFLMSGTGKRRKKTVKTHDTRVQR